MSTNDQVWQAPHGPLAAGVNAYAGTLTIGDGTGGANADVVPIGLPHATMSPESSSENPLITMPDSVATPPAPNEGSTLPNWSNPTI